MTSSDPTPSAGSTPLTRGGGAPTAWIRSHLDAVYRYARRRLPPEDAEDVAQQAFLALFEAHVAERAPDDAGAYLFGVARRRVAGVHRRRAAHRTPVSLPDGWEGFARTPLAEEALLSEELAELVHVALGFLPAGARALLEGRYRNGISTAELARRLDTTEKAVEGRLRRARAQFEDRFLAVGRDWLEVGGGAA